MRVISVVVALLVFVVVAGGWLGAPATALAGAGRGAQESEPPENPIPMSDESIAAGRTIYVRFCASCHGRSAQGFGPAAIGDVPPPNLVDDEWAYGSTDGEIFQTIAEGVPPDYFMEEWAGRISDEDIWNVINYLRDLAQQE